MKQVLVGFILAGAFLSADVQAQVPSWKIIPNESQINFTATQNGAPVTGKFTVFNGDIVADSKQLDKSHIKIMINTASVTTSYAMVADTLKTSDWLDVKQFPQAVFMADHFTETGKDTYQANGTLTLRGKTLPLSVNFTLLSNTPPKATIKGTALIKRTAYSVGQGDWAKTNEIKDEVKINFVIAADKN